MTMRGLVIALAAVLLAACAQTVPPPEPAPVAATLPAPAPEPPAPPPPPKPDPLDLLGLTPAQVQQAVDEPSLVRREDHAQVMQFQARRCVFDVVFYEPSEGEHFRAHHIEARDRKGEAVDPQSCLAALLPDGWRVADMAADPSSLAGEGDER